MKFYYINMKKEKLRALNEKSFSLITCKLVIRKKLVTYIKGRLHYIDINRLPLCKDCLYLIVV